MVNFFQQNFQCISYYTYLSEFKCSNLELGLFKKITYSPLDPLLMIFFKKRGTHFFCWLTNRLILSAVVGWIKRSRWHPHVAHHLALLWAPPFAGRPCAWGAVSILPQLQVGQNRGESKVLPTLAIIPGPYRPLLVRTLATREARKLRICAFFSSTANRTYFITYRVP